MKKKVAYLGLLLAAALICSYIESLVPFYFGVPGMKLGLTNVVVIFVMYLIGPVEAITVSVLRVLISGFMFGNVFSILYSLAGALLSFFVMYLMKRFTTLHVISVSVAGGVFHNVGQLLVALCIVSNYNIFYYLPILLIAGVVTGLLIGIISQEVILRLKRRM